MYLMILFSNYFVFLTYTFFILVSKLREHWDETNSTVLARKTQLDAMLADTQKFEAKRAELESWLTRMESRLERMAPTAHTADVLDQQIREQKVVKKIISSIIEKYIFLNYHYICMTKLYL